MKHLLWLLPLLTIQVSYAQVATSFDSSILYNNKEVQSRELSKKEIKRALVWTETQGIESSMAIANSKAILQEVMGRFVERDNYCELGLASLIGEAAISKGLIQDQEELPGYLAYLRVSNLIDDIFYKILSQSALLLGDFEDTSLSGGDDLVPVPRDINLQDLYKNFQPWPNEQSRCAIGTFRYMARNLNTRNNQDLSDTLEALNFTAYRKRIIDRQTLIKLEAMRRREVQLWNASLYSYLEVVRNAKDKLAKNAAVQGPSDFSDTYVSRREKLTQRGRLYKYYTSTQIVILASIIEKTSRRMDASKVTLNFEFNSGPDEREIYVLSPMEQYRISIKMLRKDMAETMRSENFRGQQIEFEDLIAAAFETGLISTKELDYIVKFEEFWNPKKDPAWKTYANFASSLLSSATFFLPPPWNVIGAMGIVLTQSKILNKKDKANADDNWNVII